MLQVFLVLVAVVFPRFVVFCVVPASVAKSSGLSDWTGQSRSLGKLVVVALRCDNHNPSDGRPLYFKKLLAYLHDLVTGKNRLQMPIFAALHASFLTAQINVKGWTSGRQGVPMISGFPTVALIAFIALTYITKVMEQP